MNNKLDELYNYIRNIVIDKIYEKNIDVNLLSYDLKIDTDTFLYNFSHRIDDFTFYLHTLSLIENWEG